MRLATVRAAMMLIFEKKRNGVRRMFRELLAHNQRGVSPAWQIGDYLMSFHALNSLLFFLLSEDDEGPAVFVECETHFTDLRQGGSG